MSEPSGVRDEYVFEIQILVPTPNAPDRRLTAELLHIGGGVWRWKTDEGTNTYLGYRAHDGALWFSRHDTGGLPFGKFKHCSPLPGQSPEQIDDDDEMVDSPRLGFVDWSGVQKWHISLAGPDAGRMKFVLAGA